MRCPRCGNENPETNRFCGMCGTTLLEQPVGIAPSGAAPVREAQREALNAAARQEEDASTLAASAPVATATPGRDTTPGPVAPERQESATISGPSFLGLNEPPPSRERKASLSINPDSAPSRRSLDYLLEDDEEPSGGGGAGKFFLIVLALLLAVGFGYLRWKNQGLPWLGSGSAKPAAAQNTTGGDGNPSAAPGAGSSAGSPAASAPAAGTTAAQPAAAAPAGNAPAGSAASSQPTTPSSAPASAPAATAPAVAAPAKPAPQTAAPAAATPANSAAPASTPPGPASTDATPPAANSGSGSASDANGGSSAAPAGTGNTASTTGTAASAPPAAVPEKPRPAIPAPKPDPVAEAQKYLYGQKVPQDCERGLRILKPAADGGNAKAMIEMGALYSAGLCTPRDLPTSYRWFALALRKDPDNTSLQQDLQQLWGEMTQPERQLAIRLSQ